MSGDSTPAYIGREKCGCIVGAVVDDGKHPEDVKTFLKELIDDDLIIERVTVGYVNSVGFNSCELHKGGDK